MKIPVVNLSANRSVVHPQSNGAIYENTEITKKVEQQYQLKKKEEQAIQSVNMKKNKDSNRSMVE